MADEKPVDEKKPAALAGEYALNIDTKDRLQIPALFREVIQKDKSQAVYGVEGINGNLWLIAEKIYDDLAAKRGAPTFQPTKEQQAFDWRFFGRSVYLPLDKQGRISLPQRIRDEYELSREVVMTGMRNHVEVYDRSVAVAIAKGRRERNRRNRDEWIQDQIAGKDPLSVGANSLVPPAGLQGDSTDSIK